MVPPASPDSHRPTALITGATLGIGLELTRLFARDGWRLVLVARDRERLQAAARAVGAAEDTVLIPLDLSEPDAAPALWRELTARSLSLDALVNNAGFGTYGPLAEADPEATRRMVLLNVLALTDLTRLVLPSMLARGSGRILNVASTAAFAPGPLMAVYYATKAYVLSFSDALANEVEGSGVTVTCLCPGPTRTAFQQRAGTRFSPKVKNVIMDAAPVAEAGYRGLLRGRKTVIPGVRNRLLVAIAALTPRHLAARLIRRMQEDKREGG